MIYILVFGLLLNASEPEGYFTKPYVTANGILVSDNHYSTLYLLSNSEKQQLLSAPGCGRYYTISPDRQLVGFKLIGRDGRQTPALYDTRTQQITELHGDVMQVGQVSFARDGSIAFTVENELIVMQDKKIDTYTLRWYANQAPISPDGKFAVYNDINDQLFLYDLQGRSETLITDGVSGYHTPKWSPDGKHICYLSLNSHIFVYAIETRTTYGIGEGQNPEWSPDGSGIVYCVITTKDLLLTGADLYFSSFDGRERTRFTRTPGIFEFDPAFTSNQEIIFHTYDRREICTASIKNKELTDVTVLHKEEEPLAIDYLDVTPVNNSRDSIDVPYLHQVYDTPDWFDGNWACAPTTAMMGIAYYRKLPYWDCWCSTPYGHICHFGRYICERYHYREVDYSWEAQDPVGTWAAGGYGYMWYGSNRPYTHMASYLNNHDIPSSRDDSPTFSEAINEVNAGYPYGMCVGLTAAGHLVLAIGQVLNWHTLIFNDPYGNKNTPGYPSYDGKYARYDWPGYNNGYQNLNAVYWCVTMHGDWELQTDTIVDDLQFEDGFYLHTESPSSMAYWWDRLNGYNNHTWWTYTTAANEDTCYAIWTPVLPQNGEYEVSAFIPSSDGNATAARYRVHHAGGDEIVVIDQTTYSNEWVSLGTYQFTPSDVYAYLGDATGTQGQHIAFDAVKWSYVGSGSDESAAEAVQEGLFLTTIVREKIICQFDVPVQEKILFTLYDIQGRCVTVHPVEQAFIGGRRIEIDVSSVPEGVYFLRMECREKVNVQKCIIIE